MIIADLVTKADLRDALERSELRLVIRFGVMLSLAVGVLVAVERLI